MEVRVDGPREIALLAPDVAQRGLGDDIAGIEAHGGRQVDARFAPGAARQQREPEVPAGRGAQRMMKEGRPMSGKGAILVTTRREHTGQRIERMQLGGRNGGQRAKLAGGAGEVAAALERVASLEHIVGERGWTAIRHRARATGGEEPEEDADPEKEEGPIGPLQSPRGNPGDFDRRHRVQMATIIGAHTGGVNDECLRIFKEDR